MGCRVLHGQCFRVTVIQCSCSCDSRGCCIVLRRSSVAKDHTILEIKALPLLKDTPHEKREQLFLAKLQICKVMFNFDDPDSNIKGKETKRMTLLELVDFVNSPAEQKAYLANEAMMQPLLEMVVSLLRCS